MNIDDIDDSMDSLYIHDFAIFGAVLHIIEFPTRRRDGFPQGRSPGSIDAGDLLKHQLFWWLYRGDVL